MEESICLLIHIFSHHLSPYPLFKDGIGDGDATLWRRVNEVGIDESCL
jgi:hypothetical protein